MKQFLFLLLFLSSWQLFAQSIVIKGKITDKTTQEELVGATVFIPAISKGTVTDFEGNYQLEINDNKLKDTVVIVFSYAGYTTKTVSTAKKSVITLNTALEATVLEEVVIESKKSNQEIVQSTQMSVERLDMRDVKKLPVFFGEVDVLKTIQLKPGTYSGSEGNTGIYVRGGGPDQNLFLLDGMQLYNPTHLIGFFSTFSGDAINGLELYKGNFPAQFGGRLSSVIDVKMRKGNKEKFTTTGGIGLIASRLTIEAPIIKNKLSFVLSGRRTYFDIFTRAYNKTQESNPRYRPIPDYYFQDISGKIDYTIDDKNQLSLSGFHSRDVFKVNQNRLNIDFSWGNTALGLNWKHKFNDNFFVHTLANYTYYGYKNVSQFDVFKFKLDAGITDYVLKTDFNYLKGKHDIRWGAMFTQQNFNTGRVDIGAADSSIFYADRFLYGKNYGTYVSDDITLSPRWKWNAGLRITAFNRKKQFYAGLEPRTSLRYLITENTSIKASYARMYQYVHLVTTSGASLPTDIWYPSGEGIKPQLADQVATGFSTTFGDGKWLFSNEYFYKNMQHQVDFRDGADLLLNPNLLNEFVFGRGWAYGAEFYLEKTQGKTTGWIGYTLSWSWRQFDAINNGKPFHPRYDRRHDISATVMHELTKRITLSAAWVFGTGDAVTLATGRVAMLDLPGTVAVPPGVIFLPEYGERSNYRLIPYHRLDLGLVYKFKPKRGSSDLTLSVFNAYNRLNAFFVYYEPIYENQITNTGNIAGFRAIQQSLFPIIPSVTYNFQF